MGVNLIFICILLAGAVVALIFSATFFFELFMERKRAKKSSKIEIGKVEPAFKKEESKNEEKKIEVKEAKNEVKPVEIQTESKQEEIDLDAMLAALEKRARIRTDKLENENTETKKNEIEKVVELEPAKIEEPKQEKVIADSKSIAKKEKMAIQVEEEKPAKKEEGIDPRLNLNYEDRLEKLKEVFAKLEKDYQKNTKELNKYKRTEKRKQRNEKLLNKKANELTNLNLSLYNVKDIKNIDPEKKKKQEELMAHVSELKASIADAEDYLTENKEKHTQVVKLNNYLAKEYDRYTEEIKELETFLAKRKK